MARRQKLPTPTEGVKAKDRSGRPAGQPRRRDCGPLACQPDEAGQDAPQWMKDEQTAAWEA